MAPPFGDKGLDVDSAREAVRLLSFVPVGVAKGTIVIGPMDSSYTASVKARDVLLKRIEEFPDCVQPILWAHDMGDVQGTIRSRCIERWAKGEPAEEDDVLQDATIRLVNASLKKDRWMIPGIVSDLLGKKGDTRRYKEAEVLQMATEVLSEMDHPDRFALWEAIRAASRTRNPTPTEVTLAFLGGI